MSVVLMHMMPAWCPQDIDNLPASEARRRLEAFRKRQQAAAAAKAAAATGADAQEAAAAARGAFEGAISEAFEEVLRFYVMEEQREVGRTKPNQTFDVTSANLLIILLVCTSGRRVCVYGYAAVGRAPTISST